MPASQHKTAPARRNGNNPKRAKQSTPKSGDQDSFELAELIGDWVEQRPWAMVGAATGVGIALGAATRPESLRGFARVLSATVGGIATRVALNQLVQWLQPALEEKTPR